MIRIRFFHVLDLQRVVPDRFHRPLIINSKPIVPYIILLLSVYNPFVLIVWVKVLNGKPWFDSFITFKDGARSQTLNYIIKLD